LRSGNSSAVTWSPVRAQYIGLRVRASYESGGKHHNFQIGEIEFLVDWKPGEVPAGVPVPVVYEKRSTLIETMLEMRSRFAQWLDGFSKRGDRRPPATDRQIETVWNRIRQDFPPAQNPLLEYAHFDWFQPDGWLVRFDDSELEERLIRRSIAEMGPAGGPLQRELEELASTRAPADDPRWLELCAQAARITPIINDLQSLRQAIEHLGNRFPDRYPAERFLLELAAIEERFFDKAGEWKPSDPKTGEMLERLKHEALVLGNPLLASGKLLFVKRFTYQTGWYYSEFMQAGRFGGNLCVLTLGDGLVTPIVPELSGGIFDRYDLSFDGRRVVFAYRPAPGKAFRLYEVGVDGTGLRQLTSDPPDEAERLASYGLEPGKNELGPYRGHTDDFHPCYLPDGGIAFVSSRCERGVLCDQGDNLSVNVLYRMDGDGSNVQILSDGALSESTPCLTNDGRILYTRWEYVDKGVIALQSLWAMRPNGSGSCEVYGNHHEFPPVLIHGRAIPDSESSFVCTATMHHPFAVGPILLINTGKDIRTHAPIRNLTPDTWLSVEGVGGFPHGENYSHLKNGRWVKDNVGPLFCDPYPLSDQFFLVSSNPDRPWKDETAYGLWLIDTFGNRVLVYDDPDISCWQPMPLRSREKRPVIPTWYSPGDDDMESELQEATVVLTDVYDGLEGVERGEIRYLRILEQVPRPWTAHRFWPDDATLGQNAVISMYAHIYVKILHGIVPVEEDGSAHFMVPADRNIFFQALDEDFMEVQRMRTFVNFQPGETRACIGCHERRNRAPLREFPVALSRPADRPGPQPGENVPRPLHYPTDVQPILDRHCVRCHGGEKTEGDLDLTGELTTFFNRSYENVMKRRLVRYIQEFKGPQPRAQKTNVTPLSPKALGSHASPLIQILRQGHYDVRLSEKDWARLVTWVDANGPYYGSYFGRRNLTYKDLPDFRPVPTIDSARGHCRPALAGHVD
jgi:hypothetical protein